ncbi:MAG: acetate kinase, partial [Candidatus Omnitrophica bacterium]|nr:acetate kinase [Candidatus Omnitrophota bacterium]
EMFIYRIEKYIGAYLAAMNGLDAVIFTAGVGENNPWIMKRVKRDLRNILAKKVKFLIIPTNEELLIARDTFNIIKSRF